MRYFPRFNLLIFLTLLMLVIGLGLNYPVYFDWTANQRHSLSNSSQRLLLKFSQPLDISVYLSLSQQDAFTEQAQQRIHNLLLPYQQQNAQITVHYIDIKQNPELAKRAYIQHEGELILSYQGKQTHVTAWTEQAMSQGLLRLLDNSHYVVFLTGEGERSAVREANHDLSLWAKQLTEQGLQVQSLALNKVAQVPSNVQVLIIADPRIAFLPSTQQKIVDYVHAGGNLLWLSDPDGVILPLTESLGFVIQAGHLVDRVAINALKTEQKTFVLLDEYPQHAITQTLQQQRSLFSNAVGLRPTDNTTWTVTNILPTHNQIQSSAGEAVASLGLVFERQWQHSSQRIAVIGDSDFLSNSLLGNGINLNLGLNLVDWLHFNDHQLQVTMRPLTDKQLIFSNNEKWIIGFGFLFALPLLLLLVAIWIYWKRRY